jgi:signal transduction histidine kinase
MSDKPDLTFIIASSVHDMKNSLNMLINSVETLCENIPPELRDALNASTIQYEAQRVNNDLIQLLGLYRLHNEMLSIDVDEHHVSDLFEEQIAHYHETLASRGVTLSCHYSDDLTGYFDRELILGVLNNVLNNATRYTKTAIELVAYTFDGGLKLEVHDDGSGYPEQMLHAQPGEEKKGINFHNGSTSLGLYFAARVAAMHQQGDKIGHIELSNGGRLSGGVFSIFLP